MKRFLSRWFVRCALAGLFVAMFIVQGWFGALVGWLVFAYLLIRAFPGVKKDFRFLWGAGRSRISSGISRF
jgi:hypothetical protein